MNDKLDQLPFSQQVKLELELPGAPLSVRSLHVTEAMSRLFEIELVARSEDPDVDLEAPIGRSAALGLRIEMRDGVIERNFSGLCVRAAQTRVEPSGLSTYSISLRPALWRLTQRRNYRLFQHISVLDIAKKLLDEWSIDYQLVVDESRYPKYELRTQYDESDHAFLSRLLEEAGIAYFFDDSRGRSILVLHDAPQSGVERAAPIPFADDSTLHASRNMEYVTALEVAHLALPASFAHRDYDFRRPSLPLFGRARSESSAEQAWEQYRYEPGGFLHENNEGGSTPTADDKGPGRHEEGFGTQRTTVAMERLRADKRAIRFDSSVLDLQPGRVLRVTEHPGQLLGHPLLSIEHSFSRDMEGHWKVSTRCVPIAVPYRPPAITPKPRIEAVQTATIVGPHGEEIHTDEFGRVRVQFPWDRYGNNDADSSCWMRVNQGWSGAGFGSLNLPRIGQDVLVSFLDGNPDHPIVVGRVFNATSPVPYKLPENKTVSTWKTNTSPTDGGFNELRFEDAQGRELTYFQAQKDAMGLVKNNEMQVVGADRSRLVRGSETETIVKDHTRLVQGSLSNSIGENQSSTVGKTRSSTIGENDNSFVGKLYSVTIARSLEQPLAQAMSGAYQSLAPVLTGALTSTLGEVPSTALGLPFKGTEQGPMSTLVKDLLPQAMKMLMQGAQSIQQGGGRPATGIKMQDEEIVLTTGGASITLKGDDIILSAAGNISSTSGKKTTLLAKGSDMTIQGGPMTYINPGEKSPDATAMAAAAGAGSAFVG
jgi:type VI secretion system secreted protein VgrG